MSFSRSVVIDQCLTLLGRASLRRKVAQVVRQREELQPNLIVHEVVAGQPRPLHRVLALLDPLLGRPTTVVEFHHLPRRPAEVGHDEPHAREQLALVVLDLGHHAAKMKSP